VVKRVTMADVAEHAGVSPTAVSLVLNNRVGTRLSEDTARRVRKAAAELGYRPNLTARALSTQRSEVIGFISNLASTERLGRGLIRGALREAKRLDHMLFITETEGSPEAVDEAVDALLDRQVDGIIYAAERPQQVQLPSSIAGTPVVMLNAVAERADAVVLPDEYAGGRSVVELLIDAGHTEDIAVVGSSLTQPIEGGFTVAVERRRRGIHDVLAAHDIEPIAEVLEDPWSVHNGYHAVHDLLAAGARPRSLICLNDRLAFGAYRALGEAGLTVGVDVQIVSFDDDPIAVYLEPKLTTAAAPYEDMAALAVRLVLTDDCPPGEHLVTPPLRVRGSVALPPELREQYVDTDASLEESKL
jgi:LacI family transcriptional regulator